MIISSRRSYRVSPTSRPASNDFLTRSSKTLISRMSPSRNRVVWTSSWWIVALIPVALDATGLGRQMGIVGCDGAMLGGRTDDWCRNTCGQPGTEYEEFPRSVNFSCLIRPRRNQQSYHTHWGCHSIAQSTDLINIFGCYYLDLSYILSSFNYSFPRH